MPVARRWIAISFLAALGAGCQREETPPPVPPPLTLTQLRNAEYASPWPAAGRARLVEGEYREAAAPGAATDIAVRATEFHALGDIDRDGAIDGVIVLESDPGGSGVFFDLVAVLNRAGRPLTLAPVPLGDRVQVNDVSIRAGVVRVDLVKQGPDDPQCCPTVPVTLEYRLQGDRLVAATDQDPSRSSATPSTR